MNIFFLDADPVVCAKYHCDKHVVKMIVEYAQIMSTAALHHDPELSNLYKPTHKNHPSVQWVIASRAHYNYLFNLYDNLLHEYTVRYGKIHKSSEKYNQLYLARMVIPNVGWKGDPPQCVPDDCKSDSSLSAYRECYIKHKSRFATWKTSSPDWYKNA